MIIRHFDHGTESTINYKWVPIENISKSMQKAVIASEDAKFYEHNGFDFDAIEKARIYNQKHKKKKGASTISQQTAKNVFLWPARSYLRKGLEAYFTILIEIFWSKARILEVYLNVIELGPQTYGVEAAGEKFFFKKAKALSPSEAALMTAVLPNPIKFKIKHPTSYILRRQNAILNRISRPKVVNEAELKSIDDEVANEFENENENENEIP
jgi:monofunctional biosynthetic peptidoglycan transglycosylase